jgi:hypothetical protein
VAAASEYTRRVPCCKCLGTVEGYGQRWPFCFAWAVRDEVAGGILVRAEGLGAELVRGTLDNTDIYRVVYRTLFGRLLD